MFKETTAELAGKCIDLITVWGSKAMENGDELIERILGDHSGLVSSVLNTTKSAFVITDHHGTDEPIVYCNQAFEVLTGYMKDEIIGKNCRFLQGANTDSGTRREISSAIGKGRAASVKILNYRKDGSRFSNMLLISPIYDKSGRITHFIGIQQLVADEKFSTFNKKESTQLTPDSLQTLSHELRTPLTSLSGFIQLMGRLAEAEPGTLRQQHLLGRSQASLNELSRVINEVLKDFGKRES